MSRWRRRRTPDQPVAGPPAGPLAGPGADAGPDAGPDAVTEAGPEAVTEAGPDAPGHEPVAAPAHARVAEADRERSAEAGPEPDGTRDPVEASFEDRDDEQTVQLTTSRFQRRRRARRWRMWRRVVLAVVGVGVVVGAAWLVFFSSALAVSGVQVVGTHVLSDTTVEQAAAVPLGRPLATADLDAVTRRVEALPAVKSVDVSRSWPHRVRVAVRERRAVAVVEDAKAGSGLQGVSADGVLFRRFAKRPPRLPMIHLTKRVGTPALAEAAAVAGALPSDLAPRVAFVRVASVDTITLQLRNGRQVRWGTADQSVDKGRVLAVLLRQHAAFYDVSVPGRPTITP